MTILFKLYSLYIALCVGLCMQLYPSESCYDLDKSTERSPL